jgi:hypothetical protein
MNTTVTTNQRLVTILLVVLIIFVLLLIIGTVARFLMGGWLMGGTIGMSGQMMNDMMSVCADMMRSFQTP